MERNKMSSIKNNGGSAFPRAGTPKEYSGYVEHSEGMTLRDYFAAKAMQGLLAAYPERERWGTHDYARIAYEQADAMLKARDGK
jgi:hypothetical protein